MENCPMAGWVNPAKQSAGRLQVFLMWEHEQGRICIVAPEQWHALCIFCPSSWPLPWKTLFYMQSLRAVVWFTGQWRKELKGVVLPCLEMYTEMKRKRSLILCLQSEWKLSVHRRQVFGFTHNSVQTEYPLLFGTVVPADSNHNHQDSCCTNIHWMTAPVVLHLSN